MSYAVTATYKLPASMASSTICELNVGRYTTLEAAFEGRNSAADDHLVKAIRETLEAELDVLLQVEFGVRAE